VSDQESSEVTIALVATGKLKRDMLDSKVTVLNLYCLYYSSIKCFMFCFSTGLFYCCQSVERYFLLDREGVHKRGKESKRSGCKGA